MATVILDDLYLHDASDPSQFVTVPLASEEVDPDGGVTVQAYASGRRRAVKPEGFNLSFTVKVDYADRATVRTLESWAQSGQVLIYREPRGRVAWGTLSALKVTEIQSSADIAAVDFTFLTITFDEGV